MTGQVAAKSTSTAVQLGALHPPSPKEGAAVIGASPRAATSPAVQKAPAAISAPIAPTNPGAVASPGAAASTGASSVQAVATAQTGPSTAGADLLAHLGPYRELTPGELLLAKTNDDSYLSWVSWGVTAYKSRHLVLIYYKGRLFRKYHAVFGRNPDFGTKRWEGDLRTPEGLYWIVKKHPNERWHRFLRLNYPNSTDVDRYHESLAAHEVPVIDGHLRPIGGAIGIHGTDKPRLNRWDINWTSGCISVDNDAVLDLDRILPIGTLVMIKP